MIVGKKRCKRPIKITTNTRHDAPSEHYKPDHQKNAHHFIKNLHKKHLSTYYASEIKEMQIPQYVLIGIPYFRKKVLIIVSGVLIMN